MQHLTIRFRCHQMSHSIRSYKIVKAGKQCSGPGMSLYNSIRLHSAKKDCSSRTLNAGSGDLGCAQTGCHQTFTVSLSVFINPWTRSWVWWKDWLIFHVAHRISGPDPEFHPGLSHATLTGEGDAAYKAIYCLHLLIKYYDRINLILVMS